MVKEDRRGKEAEQEMAAVALLCPRCQSRETKFCYFNNYDVNQPRHLCKACRRYWTATGALRVVPIKVAGRSARRRRRPRGGLVAGASQGGLTVASFD